MPWVRETVIEILFLDKRFCQPQPLFFSNHANETSCFAIMQRLELHNSLKINTFNIGMRNAFTKVDAESKKEVQRDAK